MSDDEFVSDEEFRANIEKARRLAGLDKPHLEVVQGGRADTDTKERADDGEKVMAELVRLSDFAYQRRRIQEAKNLGIPVAALDRMVRKRHAQDQTGQGRKVEAPKIEPWDEPVDGAELLDEMSAAIRAHIVLTPEQADTAALYSVYTHGFQLFKVTPRLGVRAPTRECGKSELLLRIQRFVPRPLATENLTGPVLFRLIEDQHPTLFVDELDNLLSERKSELLGLLNSGYAQDGKAYRLVGEKQFELREFSTFCPLVYGMIGKPTDSFNSRSIPIEMRRATPAEWRALLSLEDGEPEDVRLQIMGRKAARWVADNLDNLKAAKPNMGAMTNRPATNWRPLFAVAEIAGGDWPARARAAASVAAKVKQVPVEEEELFAVIKAGFDTTTKDYIESEALVGILAEVDGGPWAEYGKTGKAITQNALARLLRPFGIRPAYVGPEAARRRGYLRSQFEEAFASYVPDTLFTPYSSQEVDSKCASVQNAMDAGQVERSKCAAEKSGCTVATAKKPNNDGVLHRCTVADRGVTRSEGVGVSGDGEVEPSNDLPEPAAETPPTANATVDPTASAVRAPAASAPAAEPMTPCAQVEARNGGDGLDHDLDDPDHDLDLPSFLRRCHQCGAPGDDRGAVTEHVIDGDRVWLHPECRRFYKQPSTPLRCFRLRERLGPPAISSGPDDDLGDLDPRWPR